MKKLKYIIVNDNGIEKPIVFSEASHHSEVAGQQSVSSAGFCYLFPASTWGYSHSLKVKSRPEDTGIINAFFGES